MILTLIYISQMCVLSSLKYIKIIFDFNFLEGTHSINVNALSFLSAALKVKC